MTRRGPKLKGPVTDKEIKIFEQLCYIQCTLEDIAISFSITKDTLIRRIEEWYDDKFSTIFRAKREQGKISLRRKQWQSAHDKENITMQIFLGKQYLGQADRPEDTSTFKSIVYSTQIGQGGEILTEIKNKEDWDAQKNFDAKKILEEDTKTKKKAKKTTKKKK